MLISSIPAALDETDPIAAKTSDSLTVEILKVRWSASSNGQSLYAQLSPPTGLNRTGTESIKNHSPSEKEFLRNLPFDLCHLSEKSYSKTTIANHSRKPHDQYHAACGGRPFLVALFNDLATQINITKHQIVIRYVALAGV